MPKIKGTLNKSTIQYNNYKKEEQREILLRLLQATVQTYGSRNQLPRNLLPNGIYLDSPNLFFTHRIIDEKLNLKIDFELPNYIEYDKFKKTNFEHISIINSSYYDLINQESHTKYSTIFIWADYCGCFSSFYKDIDITFDKNLLGNGSIYALTFCGTDLKRKMKFPDFGESHAIVATNDFVMGCAERNGYTARLMPESGFYKSGLYTAIFTIEKVKDASQIDKQKVYYHLNKIMMLLEG